MILGTILTALKAERDELAKAIAALDEGTATAAPARRTAAPVRAGGRRQKGPIDTWFRAKGLRLFWGGRQEFKVPLIGDAKMGLRFPTFILVVVGVFAGTPAALQAQSAAAHTEQQTAPKPKRIRVGGEVMQRGLVYKVTPKYPDEAKKAHLEGTVRLRIFIGEDGNVKEAQTIEGNSVLAEAAIAAVQQFRYKPTTLNGDPVEVETEVDVTFSLSSNRPT